MAENEQSGFHEGVKIPVKPIGAGSSIHTDVTVVMPRTEGATGSSGSLLQAAVQARSDAPTGGLWARVNSGYHMVKAIAKGGMGEIHLATDGSLKSSKGRADGHLT